MGTACQGQSANSQTKAAPKHALCSSWRVIRGTPSGAIKNAHNALVPLETGVLQQQDVRLDQPHMIHEGGAHVPLRLPPPPLNLTDADVTDAAQIERARLNVTLTLYAIARLVEAQATGDARFIVAADAIKQIAETMDEISDDTVLRIATAKIGANAGVTLLLRRWGVR